MARLLFVVEHVFSVAGRGIVLVPGLRPAGDEAFRNGDPILLRKPDGGECVVTIGGLSLPNPNPEREVWILLRREKEDVPLGTEVWSVDAN